MGLEIQRKMKALTLEIDCKLSNVLKHKRLVIDNFEMFPCPEYTSSSEKITCYTTLVSVSSLYAMIQIYFTSNKFVTCIF